MNWLRRRLATWLGVDAALLVGATADADVAAERAAREALEETVKKMAETERGLAQALQATVAQLNRNTVIMQRWAKESATLEAIETRHALKEAHGTNGGRILRVPPGASL